MITRTYDVYLRDDEDHSRDAILSDTDIYRPEHLGDIKVIAPENTTEEEWRQLAFERLHELNWITKENEDFVILK